MSNTNLVQAIKATEESFMAKVVTAGMLHETEAHFAMQMLEKNKYSLDAAINNPKSVKDAMINVAAIGLSLNPANADAYLVPRDGAICLDISYRGLIKLAVNTGEIKWVQAEMVFEKDNFEFNGVGEKPLHTSNPFLKDKGVPIGVYCTAKTVDGDFLTTIMTADEVEDVRKTSKAAGSSYSPWNTFPQEMWKKTVIKRAAKTWPKPNNTSAEILHKAIDVVNQHEGLQDISKSTQDQDAQFEEYVLANNAMSAYCFSQSLEIEVRSDLIGKYVKRHAPHRGIGKFKATLMELIDKGRKEADKYVTDLNELNSNNDEYGVEELVAELYPVELEFLLPELDVTAQELINEIGK